VPNKRYNNGRYRFAEESLELPYCLLCLILSFCRVGKTTIPLPIRFTELGGCILYKNLDFSFTYVILKKPEDKIRLHAVWKSC